MSRSVTMPGPGSDGSITSAAPVLYWPIRTAAWRSVVSAPTVASIGDMISET